MVTTCYVTMEIKKCPYGHIAAVEGNGFSCYVICTEPGCSQGPERKTTKESVNAWNEVILAIEAVSIKKKLMLWEMSKEQE